jgi:hypothetical protein
MEFAYPRPTWHYIACPTCHHYRDLFCHDHGEPVKVEAVEVVPVVEVVATLREIQKIAAREWAADETNYEWYGDIAGIAESALTRFEGQYGR